MAKTTHLRDSSVSADVGAQALDARAKDGVREILEAEHRLHEWPSIRNVMEATQASIQAMERSTGEHHIGAITNAATTFLDERPKALAKKEEMEDMLYDVFWAEHRWAVRHHNL